LFDKEVVVVGPCVAEVAIILSENYEGQIFHFNGIFKIEKKNPTDWALKGRMVSVLTLVDLFVGGKAGGFGG
jgi:hypothetical protein